MIRAGWVLAVLGLGGFVTTEALGWSWPWAVVCSGLLWVAAWLLAEGYQDGVRTGSIDEAIDAMDRR